MASLDDVAGEVTQTRIDIAELRVELREGLKVVRRHDEQLRDLDRWRWKVTGLAAGAGGVAGLIASWVFH